MPEQEEWSAIELEDKLTSVFFQFIETDPRGKDHFRFHGSSIATEEDDSSDEESENVMDLLCEAMGGEDALKLRVSKYDAEETVDYPAQSLKYQGQYLENFPRLLGRILTVTSTAEIYLALLADRLGEKCKTTLILLEILSIHKGNKHISIYVSVPRISYKVSPFSHPLIQCFPRKQLEFLAANLLLNLSRAEAERIEIDDRVKNLFKTELLEQISEAKNLGALIGLYRKFNDSYILNYRQNPNYDKFRGMFGSFYPAAKKDFIEALQRRAIQISKDSKLGIGSLKSFNLGVNIFSMIHVKNGVSSALTKVFQEIAGKATTFVIKPATIPDRLVGPQSNANERRSSMFEL